MWGGMEQTTTALVRPRDIKHLALLLVCIYIKPLAVPANCVEGGEESQLLSVLLITEGNWHLVSM